MKKEKIRISLLMYLCFFLFFFTSIGYSSEKQISVYYPSPYGEYIEARTERLVVGTGNYMDHSAVIAEDGVLLIQNGLAITIGKDGGYLNVKGKTARLRVDMSSSMLLENNESLIYTNEGQLLIGDMLLVEKNYQESKLYIADMINNIKIGMGMVNGEGIGNYGDFGGQTNVAGIRVEGDDGKVLVGGGAGRDGHGCCGVISRTNGTTSGFVAANDGGNPGLTAMIYGDGESSMILQSSNRAAVIFNNSNSTTEYKQSGSHQDAEIAYEPFSATDNLYVRGPRLWIEQFDETGPNVDSMVYIEMPDDHTAALYWGDDTNAYGFLGYDNSYAAVRIGTVVTEGSQQRLELTTNDIPAIGIDSRQEVVIGNVVHNFGALDSALTINSIGRDKLLKAASGNSGLVVKNDGSVIVSNTLVIGGRHFDAVPRSLGGKNHTLDVRGYAVVNDIYLASPNEGSPRWISSGGRIDYSNCRYTSDSTATSCPSGYVAVGFDCTGSCKTKHMKLRCCRLN